MQHKRSQESTRGTCPAPTYQLSEAYLALVGKLNENIGKVLAQQEWGVIQGLVLDDGVFAELGYAIGRATARGAKRQVKNNNSHTHKWTTRIRGGKSELTPFTHNPHNNSPAIAKNLP
jgi:hypothetical protein